MTQRAMERKREGECRTRAASSEEEDSDAYRDLTRKGNARLRPQPRHLIVPCSVFLHILLLLPRAMLGHLGILGLGFRVQGLGFRVQVWSFGTRTRRRVLGSTPARHRKSTDLVLLISRELRVSDGDKLWHRFRLLVEVAPPCRRDAAISPDLLALTPTLAIRAHSEPWSRGPTRPAISYQLLSSSTPGIRIRPGLSQL